MPSVVYQASAFDRRLGPLLHGTQVLQFTWTELVHAAITVGRNGWREVVKNGRFSSFEMAYRASLLYANLREDGGGRIVRSAAYDGLDPSEKSAVSYFVGLTMAKLFADKLLGVSWLLHLDVYRRLTPQLRGNTRPDLVGLDPSGRWIVVEAKGRTNSITEALMKSAKLQTRGLKSIAGQSPVLRMACAAYFSSGELTLRVEDPVEPFGDAPSLDVSEDDVLERYYQPMTDVLNRSGREISEETVGGRTASVVQIDELDFGVGMLTGVKQGLNSEPGRRSRLASLVPERGLPLDRIEKEAAADPPEGTDADAGSDESLFVGTDGILVRLGRSWSSEEISLEPEDRTSP